MANAHLPSFVSNIIFIIKATDCLMLTVILPPLPSQTMKIENPNIKGSGYIEHPPQLPFAGRVVMQPTTIKPDDVPEWFGSAAGGPGHQQQHYKGPPSGRGPGNHGHRSYSTGRGYQSTTQRAHVGAVAAHHSAPPIPRQNYHPNRPEQRPAPQAVPQHHPNAASMHPQRPITPGVFDTSMLMNALQQQQAAPVGQSVSVPCAPEPVVRVAPEPAVHEESEKLSKSQKAKLRKKMREGKA